MKQIVYGNMRGISERNMIIGEDNSTVIVKRGEPYRIIHKSGLILLESITKIEEQRITIEKGNVYYDRKCKFNRQFILKCIIRS